MQTSRALSPLGSMLLDVPLISVDPDVQDDPMPAHVGTCSVGSKAATSSEGGAGGGIMGCNEAKREKKMCEQHV